MMLFKFKEKSGYYGFHFFNYRWTVQFDADLSSLKNLWISLALVKQYRDKENPQWDDSYSQRYSIELNPYWWAFGFTHDYYDGPLCFFSLGWLHFQLGANCKKCNNNY